MTRKNDAADEPDPEVSILARLPSCDTYRKLASQLREAARVKTDAYARNAMFKLADDYDQFANHLEEVRAFYRSAVPPPPGENA